jgi:hypothetical protein
MGIKKFEANYFKNQIIDCNLKFDRIYIDSNNYFIYFMRNIEYFKETLKNEPFFDSINSSHLFVSYLINRLNPSLTSNGKIHLIFDSKYGRKMIKWASCLNRNYDGNDFNEIVQRQLPHNVTITISKYDADYNIFNLVKHDIVTILEPSCVCINEHDVIISNIAIVSGDTDFLCFFPNKELCCNLTIHENYNESHDTETQSIFSKKNIVPYSLVIRNFEVDIKSIEKMTSIDIFTHLELIKKKFLSLENYIDFVIKIIGMVSPNDYQTSNFWSCEIFKTIIEQHSFVLTKHYEINLVLFRSLAAIYWSMYIERFRFRKEMYTNSLRILNYDGDMFYQYDFVSNLNVLTKEYVAVVEGILLNMLEKFDGIKTKDDEKNFKLLLKHKQKQTLVMKDLLKEYCKNKNSIEIENVLSSTMALRITSMLGTFFLNDNKKKLRAQLLFISRTISKNLSNRFLSSLLGYFDLRNDLNIKFFKIKIGENTKIFYYSNKTLSN